MINNSKYSYLTAKIICCLLFASSLFTLSVYSQIPTGWNIPVNLVELNTGEDDFAPVWEQYEQVLYFNSIISGYSNFFTALRDSIKYFAGKSLARGDLNARRQNRSYITFASETEALLSAYRLSSARAYMNIFRSEKRKQVWAVPQPVESLSGDFFIAHPAISSDGTFIVFATDKNSIDGDTDLWIAYRNEDGSFGSAMPLEELNSPGNEITPFLSLGDTLYFASNGQFGPGGYDLFFSVKSDGVWERPKPLYELNTPYDESDFALMPWGDALFASNRPGGAGGLDLYYVERLDGDKIQPPEPKIELSLATQTSTIKRRVKRVYKNLPVSQYIFLDDTDNIPENSIAVKHFVTNPDNLNSIDSVYYYSPVIIANRLKEKTLAELIAFKWVGAETGAKIDENERGHLLANFAEMQAENLIGWQRTMKQLFVDTYNIHRQKVVFGIQLYKATYRERNYYVQFFSKDKYILSPYRASIDSVMITPRILDIYPEGRPDEIIASWQVKMYIDNYDCGTVARGTRIGDKFSLDLGRFEERMKYADSVVIVLSALSTLGQISETSLSLEISGSEVSEPAHIRINGTSHKEYFLIAPDQKSVRSGSANIEVLKELEPFVSLNKRMIVQYFVPETKSIAETVKKYFETIASRQNPLIKLEQGNKECCAEFSSSFAKYIIRILVEE